MSYPHSKPPATLIATLGTEPQVVTATLDLLLLQGENVTQTVVLHTVAPETPIADAVDTLQQAFEQPPYRNHIALLLKPLADVEGHPLRDVETPSASQSAFRVLYNQVRIMKQSGVKIHLSIAGGRKTLAVYGMLAAQLLFDDQDRLWHLYSAGDYLSSKRLHPMPGDQVHLISIPVVQWSNISPMLLDMAEIDDPFEALKRQNELRLAERLEEVRAFVRGSLTPAEERVVALLVREGISDNKIAERLVLSPRTVEQHLRSSYLKAAAHWNLPNVNRSQLITLLNMFYSLT